MLEIERSAEADENEAGQAIVSGWNEIDAVALQGQDGSIQWASNAWASSCFGSNQMVPNLFWPEHSVTDSDLGLVKVA